jgi:hypothetical protein
MSQKRENIWFCLKNRLRVSSACRSLPIRESHLYFLKVGVSIFPLSIIFRFDFGTIPTVWYALLEVTCIDSSPHN